MRRRTLLAALGAAAGLAGCTTGDEPGDGGDTGGGEGTPVPPTATPTATGTTTGGSTDTPEDCPTSRGLGVEPPEDLDASAVESFVEAYEHVYYRDVVVEYEPESRLDSYELDGGVTDPPRRVGDGWELEYSGSGGIYRPTLALGARRTDPPDGADVVPVDGIDEGPVAETLEEAAETGEAEHHVEPPGEKVDRYVDLFASLSEDFERLSGRGDSDTLYVDVDGTAVELTVAATDFHGDYWWTAWYYVDERVVRRTGEEGVDPRDGELLECREPG